MLSERQIIESVIWACEHEVRAPKPGNVNGFSDAHQMEVDDFIRSAHAIAPIMAKRNSSVGRRIYDAIVATRKVVNCNTNLGIILLFAPLCEAIQVTGNANEYHTHLQGVLSDLTIEDADLAYQAIRLAEAGGLGEKPSQDIRNAPTITLLEAMDLAKSYDAIALQYVNNYREVWQLIWPALRVGIEQGEPIEWATSLAYLKLLSEMPDSLIQRKQSASTASIVKETAKKFLLKMNKNSKLKTYQAELIAWDKELKQEAINPGTSADLIAATLLVHKFMQSLPNNRISVP